MIRLKKALFEAPKKVIISKNPNFSFDENPHNLLNGKQKFDQISKELSELMVGVDISHLQKFRVKDSEGNFYYDTSGWHLVEAIRSQKEINGLQLNEEYLSRLKYGLGPYKITFAEKHCNVNDAT